MAQWSTLMPCNREAAGSNLSGVLAFFLKGAHYEVDYCGKKTYLAGLQCKLTSSCAKTDCLWCFATLVHVLRLPTKPVNTSFGENHNFWGYQ